MICEAVTTNPFNWIFDCLDNCESDENTPTIEGRGSSESPQCARKGSVPLPLFLCCATAAEV